MIASLVKAQDFASPGTSWIYSDHEIAGNHSYPRGIVSIADTVVNGQPAHIVIGDCLCGGGQTNYLYELNRRVYFFNFQTSQFNILYDFNLNAGDYYMLYPQGIVSDSFYVMIDSTGTDTINGFLRKTQYVHVQPFFPQIPYAFSGKIIEGIGSEFCLYPQYGFCDPPTSGLRCYQDSILGFYDTHLAPACDSIYVINIGIDEAAQEITAAVSPNPFSQGTEITIHSPANIEGTITVTDPAGRRVFAEAFSGNKIRLDGSRLDAGIYFFNLQMGDSYSAGKFIKD